MTEPPDAARLGAHDAGECDGCVDDRQVREGLGKFPAHFGLSESTDTGRMWRSLSLEGEADFHALEAAGDRVYGVDSQSGRLMFTEDGERWRTPGQLPAADVAAHPGDPDLVLLTDGSGSLVRLQVSGTPELVESAPLRVEVDQP